MFSVVNKKTLEMKFNILIQLINAVFTICILMWGYFVTATDLGGQVLTDTEACKLSPIDAPENMLRCKCCNGWVGDRWVHCDVCGKCVPQFDHHCIWLNNCIGGKNFYSFFPLLCSYFMHSLFSVTLGITSLFLS